MVEEQSVRKICTAAAATIAVLVSLSLMVVLMLISIIGIEDRDEDIGCYLSSSPHLSTYLSICLPYIDDGDRLKAEYEATSVLSCYDR
jgi:hypothetical protein